MEARVANELESVSSAASEQRYIDSKRATYPSAQAYFKVFGGFRRELYAYHAFFVDVRQVCRGYFIDE